jgi:hypothetical protein
MVHACPSAVRQDVAGRRVGRHLKKTRNGASLTDIDGPLVHAHAVVPLIGLISLPFGD